MPNFTFMAVQWVYLLALAVWVGGMIAFITLVAPALVAALDRESAGRVVAVFLGRFRAAVTVAIALLAATSVAKFLLWETVTPWLLVRWGCLAGMTALALYDFGVISPKLAAAKAAGDTATFGRVHRVAVASMGLTVLLGLAALFFS
ncbi:MAG: DUF4149 domain-containing protein [Nitrospirota bacterium]|nr:DUF4149 domain-containing protein [Nitrospirota bacterium]